MKRFVIFLFAFLFLSMPVFAQELDEDGYNQMLNGYDLSFFEKMLGSDAYELLKELGISDFNFDSVTSLSPKQLFEIIKKLAVEKIKTPLEAFTSIIAIICLSALFQGIKTDSNDLNNTFSTVSALIVSTIIIIKISPSVSVACASIKIAGNFIFAFVPVFASIVAASGGITTSFSTNSMLLILSGFLSFLSANAFVPVINSFLAISICSSLRSELNLERLVSSLKWAMTSILSFLSAVFVSIVSFKTSVASKADALGIRSARFAINSVVPVIGGSLSEGLLSIQSYSSLIKSSVGIVGIIGAALVFLPAVIEVALWRAGLGAAMIVSDIFNDKNVSSALNAFKDTMLLINVVLIISMLTTVVSIGILVNAGTGA